MNLQGIRYFFTGLLLLSSQLFASANPIAWQLNQSFQNPVISGRTYSITYTFINQLPFKLVKPLVIEKNASPQSEFSYRDTCTGKYLLPNERCQVEVILNPLINGTKYVQLIIAGYDNNRVPLPQISVQATGDITTRSVQGQVIRSLPATLEAGSSANYLFRFMNKGTVPATNVVAQVTQTTGTLNIIDNNCPATLAVNASCFIRGTFTPSSAMPAAQYVTARLTFDNEVGSPLILSTNTVVSAPDGDISGSLVAPNYLPPLMTPGSDYPVQFLFSNVSTGSVPVISSLVSCVDNNNVDCSASFTPLSSSCNIASLPPTAACQLSGTFTAPAASNPLLTYTLTASLTYTGSGSPATVSTTGTVVPSLSTSRTISIVNQCTFPVWFSLNGSAVPGQSCAAGCPAGTSCNSGSGECYWNNFAPNTGTWQLASGGGSTTVTIPAPGFNSDGVQWSGNISASTLCNGTTRCGQADCSNNGGSSACAPGQGFSQPATQAEITMNLNSDDSYDVEVINGFHLPIAMEPVYYSGISAVASNYECGSPGKFAASNHFGACNWGAAVPPGLGYFWVTTSATACDINSALPQCSGGQICGLDNTLTPVCGNFLGFWSSNEVCSKAGLSTIVSNYFHCSQALPTMQTSITPPFFPANSTLYDLMACSVPTGDTSPTFNSCYLSYATGEPVETCCGCVDWWNPSETGSVVIGANSATQSCTSAGGVAQTDPQWTQNIQPMIQWMKAACPSAYTYPFDDKSSGFSCSNNLPGASNSAGYTITFCQGNSGLPANTNDGR